MVWGFVWFLFVLVLFGFFILLVWFFFPLSKSGSEVILDRIDTRKECLLSAGKKIPRFAFYNFPTKNLQVIDCSW